MQLLGGWCRFSLANTISTRRVLAVIAASPIFLGAESGRDIVRSSNEQTGRH
jgi:hypothetical protein